MRPTLNVPTPVSRESGNRFRFIAKALGCALLVALGHGVVSAQTTNATANDIAAAPEVPAAPEIRQLEPFVASYQVFNEGRALGNATMQVLPVAGERWRIDLTMKGGGLLRLTGLNVQQSTVFDNHDNRYRPLSQASVKRVFLSNRKTVGNYDWNNASAKWTGDVKDTRRDPVPLQPGDMSGLLINLAVIRDADPGETLQYRFVDDGRAREHVYQVAPETELIQVGELSYDAMRVERVEDGGDQTVIWVAKGVPTPIRILQREDGQDSTDLRLVEYN